MEPKLESRFQGEMSITSDDTNLMAESKEELKSFLMKVKEENGKSWLLMAERKEKLKSFLMKVKEESRKRSI